MEKQTDDAQNAEQKNEGKPGPPGGGGGGGMFDFKTMTPKLSQLTDRFGNSFFFGNAGDYWHPPMPIGADTDFRTHLRKIREMEIRPDDVLLCAFPKTGAHWHMEMIKMLMNKSADHIPEHEIVRGFLDLTRPEIVAQMPSPRFIVTHVPFRYLPRQAFEKKIKIVFLERNPKDVLVSYYNHLHSHTPPINYPGTFEQFYRLYMECGFYYGDLFDYLIEWQRGREAHPDVDVYTSVFEDMKLDPLGGLKKLNDYLGTGCDEQLLEEITVACSFKNLKAYKDEHMPEFMKAIFKDKKVTLYRKGDVGDWKNWFTVAMNQEFEEEYKKRMGDYKFKYKYTL